jgi:hypothetical protein
MTAYDTDLTMMLRAEINFGCCVLILKHSLSRGVPRKRTKRPEFPRADLGTAVSYVVARQVDVFPALLRRFRFHLSRI